MMKDQNNWNKKDEKQDWMGDAKMTQEEMDALMKQVEKTAEDVQVPQSLTPEAVKAKLSGKKRRFGLRRATEFAAAIALVAVVSGTGIYGMIQRSGAGEGTVEDSAVSQQQNAGATVDENMDAGVPEEKLAKVGDYYLAENYDQVYDAVQKYQEDIDSVSRGDVVDGFFNGAIIKEPSEDLSTGAGMKDGAIPEGAVENSGASDVGASMESAEENKQSDHSDTNTQVEGVDESDFIKNDGNYLYIQTSTRVSVIDIRGEKMEQVAAFTPDMGASDVIVDMYVDGDQLFIILQKRDTSMDSQEVFDESYETYSVSDYYVLDTNVSMELLTYDISDRSKAKLVGTVNQEGAYYDSRKVGDYIYLFSRKDVYGATAKDKEDAIIPRINGEKVAADCFYLQDYAGNELIISSVSAKDPSKTVDQMVLMNSYAQIYVSTEAIYLYSGDYDWSGDTGVSYTDIVKFSYKDGRMNGVGAANVRGTIQDVFAISESDGILRVLTTDWSSSSENQLYLLDEKLKLLGSLTGIAKGEEIYAARYIGNTAYFITYHNTDPLFAVDISDPTNPKMLGQIEITGFSDYLHPYGDGLLLGIGYETDPDTSERLGVKLVMFDISDPTELKILDTVTFDGDYCSATDYYKSALVSTSKNLIGFEVTDWGELTDNMTYKLYGWEDGRFVKRLSEDVGSNGYDTSKIRGLYAGDRFYLVNEQGSGYQIRSYDMKADYKTLDELVIE